MEQLILIPLTPTIPTPRADHRKKVVTLMADAVLAVAATLRPQVQPGPKVTKVGHPNE